MENIWFYRLFMMGIDILEKGEILTHRPESDLKLLRSIRNGDYIPDNPDMEAVGRFVERINRHVIMEDFCLPRQ